MAAIALLVAVALAEAGQVEVVAAVDEAELTKPSARSRNSPRTRSHGGITSLRRFRKRRASSVRLWGEVSGRDRPAVTRCRRRRRLLRRQHGGRNTHTTQEPTTTSTHRARFANQRRTGALLLSETTDAAGAEDLERVRSAPFDRADVEKASVGVRGVGAGWTSTEQGACPLRGCPPCDANVLV